MSKKEKSIFGNKAMREKVKKLVADSMESVVFTELNKTLRSKQKEIKKQVSIYIKSPGGQKLISEALIRLIKDMIKEDGISQFMTFDMDNYIAKIVEKALINKLKG